jgi:hypothetical protein
MMATKYAPNRPRRYTLGRHYSRFLPFCSIAHLQYQRLADLKKVKTPKSGGESAKFG